MIKEIAEYFGKYLSPSRPLIGFAIEISILILLWILWARHRKRIKEKIRGREEINPYYR